jgi:hypothetical protein
LPIRSVGVPRACLSFTCFQAFNRGNKLERSVVKKPNRGVEWARRSLACIHSPRGGWCHWRINSAILLEPEDRERRGRFLGGLGVEFGCCVVDGAAQGELRQRPGGVEQGVVEDAHGGRSRYCDMPRAASISAR